jgi:hypothetical protein
MFAASAAHVVGSNQLYGAQRCFDDRFLIDQSLDAIVGKRSTDLFLCFVIVIAKDREAAPRVRAAGWPNFRRPLSGLHALLDWDYE